MRLRTMAATAAVASLALSGLAATPSFAADDPTGVVTDVLTPEQEAQVHAEADAADTVDMFYKGQRIDPASGWSGAQICVEVSADGTMQCFDTDAEANRYLSANAPTAEARAGAKRALTNRAYRDCPNSYVCLWQNSNYSGRRLQWPTYDESKTRHLNQYSPSFRDKASSAYINRPQRGVELYDFRTGLPDAHLFLGSGYSRYANFSNIDYAYGGSWNDRADAIKF
ncbi:peptidase inhibitor family I36 protein [Streptomyces sp. NPDC020747]|uniref:peptidase inhibitor family I36 protein n=1 Tax=Streptomyces sp. NPDC020747 TaxID=3365086 RepID=UPI0037A5DEF2